ncbi:hypothetical protein GOODEAATRI_021812, partial [Goodea atripinnis]
APVTSGAEKVQFLGTKAEWNSWGRLLLSKPPPDDLAINKRGHRSCPSSSWTGAKQVLEQGVPGILPLARPKTSDHAEISNVDMEID